MQSCNNLRVWERAHQLTLDTYCSSNAFPREEMYGLTNQMRRSAVSVGANIAEGSCRDGDVEFRRFLQIALGSPSELEYHLVLAHDLALLSNISYERLQTEAVEVKRMLASLLQKLGAESRKQRAGSQ